MLRCPCECHQPQMRAFIEVRVGGFADSNERCREARDWEAGVGVGDEEREGGE